VPKEKFSTELRPNSSDGMPVVERLLELIQQKRLGVGDRLPNIRELAATLGVNTSSVRDAFLQAQTMGILRILPRSGAYIQSLTYAPLVGVLASTIGAALLQADNNLLQLLDARRLIEIELAGRAAERRRLEELLPVRQALDAMIGSPSPEGLNNYIEADVRFHNEIARLVHNPVLLTIQEALTSLVKPHIAQIPLTRVHRARTENAHAEIYAALIDGNPEKARAAMDSHLTYTYDQLLQKLHSLPKALGDRSTMPEDDPPGELGGSDSRARRPKPGL
jgi:DNA-binding FadR family transcriptional regulator